MTFLCVSIFVRDFAQARRDMLLASEVGADMVELRLDECTDGQIFQSLISSAPLPVIATLRPTWEGGTSTLSNAERCSLLKSAIESGATGVDIELKAVECAGQLKAPRRIVSSHDFQGRPDRLYNLLKDLNDCPGDISKIVWTARTIRDNLEVFEILRTRSKPTIALCMGEAGLISRVLAKKFGAFLTFTSLDSGSNTASGQVPIDQMKKLYRWDSIGEKTKVYGVVAQPVMHSMSPAIHNAAFDATGHDGVDLPMLVEGSFESFKAFMESFLHAPGLDLSGLSITIPHKENALRYLKEKGAEVEPLAEQIGAVNTIIIRRHAGTEARRHEELKGINTDYAAILDSITDKLKITREQLKDYRVAVIGAGGTGRTAVAALAHYGATVLVYNRTLERAEALAKEFNGRSGKVVAAPMEKLCASCCQIYINTTSVGMYPKVDESPLGDNPPKFTDETVVFDAIYNPMKTKLLKQADAARAKTISGVEMFVRQAVAQFEAWTGLKAPVDVMRKVIESRLNSN